MINFVGVPKDMKHLLNYMDYSFSGASVGTKSVERVGCIFVSLHQVQTFHQMYRDDGRVDEWLLNISIWMMHC